MRDASSMDPNMIPKGMERVRRAKIPDAITRASGKVRITSSVTGTRVLSMNLNPEPEEGVLATVVAAAAAAAILSMRPKVCLAAPVLPPALRLAAKSS